MGRLGSGVLVSASFRFNSGGHVLRGRKIVRAGGKCLGDGICRRGKCPGGDMWPLRVSNDSTGCCYETAGRLSDSL